MFEIWLLAFGFWLTIMEHYHSEPQSLVEYVIGLSITIVSVSSTSDGISSPGWAAGKITVRTG